MQVRADQGEWDDVVWGNAASVDAQLKQLGEKKKDMKAWFAHQGV